MSIPQPVTQAAAAVPAHVEGLTTIQARLYAHLRENGPAHGEALLVPVLGRRYGSDNLIATHIYRMRKRLAAVGVAVLKSRKHGYSLAPLQQDAAQ